ADKTFKEVRRLRTERNAQSLEELALALVARGQDRARKGDRPRAEADYANAIGLDPHLSDAYFARALVEVRKGPFGILQSVRDTVRGLTARLDTSRGQYFGLLLVVPVGLFALFLTVAAFAGAVLIRNGSLLRHDLEERLGEGGTSFGAWVVLLLLPCITFQGFGWLPLWWLALLFVYLSRAEQAVALLVMLLGLGVGPAVKLLDERMLAEKNPLFRAAVQSIEGGPDSISREALEQAMAQHPDDRDLVYLLGLQYKKSGRYDDAATLYREILRSDGEDRIALNNLANLEFARGEFAPAIARYKQGSEQSPTPEITATFFYNLSLAHLQRFEYQPAQEARSQAERLAGGLVRTYDGLWRYDNGNYAVVDLALTADEAWAKFVGSASGPGRKNVAGRRAAPFDAKGLASEALNRFAGFLGVFAAVAFVLQRWRGKKMFTMRCNKCGTPFCKLCHLGAAGGLCTQCFHLFVVRDGVSGPARNQKLMEVQREDEKRERIFRALSLLSPGAGHCYAQKPVLGVALAFVWYGTLALVLLAGRVLPLTEASSSLTGPWGLGLAALVLLATYVVANRARPDFEVVLPAPRSAGRRKG
ncbi:MAG TPA: tetratricopeptide repeat protein, partial [Vicinamibacteria bacterium]|nr:tetratricopeptide repeat protein [Vicinamibacteria bacterium]